MVQFKPLSKTCLLSTKKKCEQRVSYRSSKKKKPPIITEYLRKENLVSPSIDTESKIKINYLETIAGHGHASAALGT